MIALAAEGFPSLALDLPGHGTSAGQPCTYGATEVPLLAELLSRPPTDGSLAIWAEASRGERPVALAGESLGGLLALRLALRLATEQDLQLLAVAAAGVPWELQHTAMRFFQGSLGVPLKALATRAIRSAERSGCYSMAHESPAAMFTSLPPMPHGLPSLIILRGLHDRLVVQAEAESLRDAWNGVPGSRGSTMIGIEEHGHAGLLNHRAASVALAKAIAGIQQADAGG